MTYSFTIKGYPNSQNCQIFFLLSPNPAARDNALDWNETNCVYVEIQGGANNGYMAFKYKVNETSGQDMYGGGGIYTNAPGSGNPESGMLAQVSPATGGVLGTWKIKFTSDTAGQIIAPDNTTTNFTMPAYNAALFAENPAAGRPGVYVYLGGQANNNDAMNQAFVFSNFSITGTPGAFSENFLTDTVLDTTNNWALPGSAPLGTFVLPAADAGGLWLNWTLPDSGFSLESSSTLSGGSLAWASPTAGPVIGMVGVKKQLVSPSELPAGNAAFFRLIKRTFTQLQILLPGMTAAPNTESGYTGSPTDQQADSDGDYPFNVIVNSTDNNWNVVNSGTDSIGLTSSDSGNFIVNNIPEDLSLSGGTVTFSVCYLADGSATITATDLTDGTKTAATSPVVNY